MVAVVKDATDPAGADFPVEALVELKLRRQAEDDFYTFVKLAWPVIEPGERFIGGWAAKSICEHLEELHYGRIKRLLINQPPRTSKSSLVSVLYPVWCWIRNASDKFMCVSYSESLAMRDNVKSRRLIKSDWFQKRWGDRVSISEDQSTKTRVDNLQGGYRYIAGMDGTVTGEGANCFVAGTLVRTDKGDIPIEVIAASPKEYKAISWNFSLAKEVKSSIVASLTNKAIGIYEVHTSKGNVICCTPEHLIFIEGRGFTKANEIRIGDRVHGKSRQRNSSWPAMRLVQEKNQEANVRSSEIPKTWRKRLVLFRRLPLTSSCYKKLQTMRSLWKKKITQRNEILFRKMQGFGARHPQKETGYSLLSYVSSDIREKILSASILLKNVCRCGALIAYGGERQLQFSTGNSMVQQSFWEIEGFNYRTRWGALFDMFRNERPMEGSEWSEGIVSTCSPHRRRKNKPLSGKSCHSLYIMPHAASRGDSERITEIKFHGTREEQVYDIQVEETHNFFANRVLVHNCLILDDPNSTRDSSEVLLDNAIEFYTQVLPTRFNDFKTGRMVVVQQRTNELDVSGWILAHQSKDFCKLILPMEFEESRRCVTVPLKSTGGKPWQDPRTKEGELLVPERIGPKELQLLKTALRSEYAIAGQLQQRPAPAEGGMIKRSWFQPWKQEESPKIKFVIQMWDTGATTGKKSAYSACITCGIFDDDNGNPALILLSVWRKKVEFPELYKAVQRMARDYRATTPEHKVNPKNAPDLVMVEEKSTGVQLIQTLNKTGLVLVGWRPDKYGDKVERVRRVTHILEAGRFYVPYRGPDFRMPKQYADFMISQCAIWPAGESRDLVDCLSALLQRVINSGWVLHPLERQAENQRQWDTDYIGGGDVAFY